MQKPFRQICVFFLALTLLSACDAVNEDEDAGSDGATPTTTVAQAIGPVNQFIATDTLAVANELAANTAIALQEIYDYDEPVRSDRFFQAAINQANIEDVFTFGSDTGTMQIEDLAQALTAAGQATNNEWPGDNCTSDGTCDCAFGGTRDYTGTLNITSDTGSHSGSIEGDYAITYTDCIEAIPLDVSDTPCNVFVKLTGTVEQTVVIQFSDFIETTNFSDYATSSDLDIEQSTITQVPMSFNLSSSASGTFTTEENAEFDFVYDYTDGTPQVRPDGAVTYDDVEYNMIVMQNFVEDSTNAEVCQ